MKPSTRFVLGLSATLAIVFLLLAFDGCGHAQATHDPLVGTWQQINTVDPTTPLWVIAKVGDGYQGTIVYAQHDAQAQMTLTRRGNELAGQLHGAADSFNVTLTYSPTAGHLISDNHVESQVQPVEMSKLSDSVTIPRPSPPPLTQMRTVALGHHATRAWYVELPLRDAFKLISAEWAVPGEGPTTPTYVVIMGGDFGTDEISHQRYTWAAVPLLPHDLELSLGSCDTHDLALTPLSLATP